MDPFLGANLRNPAVGSIERLFGPATLVDGPTTHESYMQELTGRLLGGNVLPTMFGNSQLAETTPTSPGISRGDFLRGPVRAVRRAIRESGQAEKPLCIFERMAGQFDEFEDIDDEKILDWKRWFLDTINGLDVEGIGKFIESTGIGTIEAIQGLLETKIGRREFSQVAALTGGAIALKKSPLGLITPKWKAETPAATLPSSEETHTSRISRVDLIASSTTSTVFAGIIGLQFIGKLEMSPKTSALMVAVWGAKMLALNLDSRGLFGSSEEDRHASQAAFEHEWAELSNIKIAYGLTGAAEIASHLYLDRYYGEINAEEIWKTISGGERVMVPLNGGTEQIELTFADFEAWLNIEKASDVSPEKTDLVKKIISGEGLEDISDEDSAELIEAWITDKRVESTLDKYEDARYELELSESRIQGTELSTTVSKLNDPETEHEDDLRLAGHIRKWIKIRDDAHDEIPQVPITEEDLSEYLVSREAELYAMSHETLDAEILNLEEKIRRGVWKMNAMAAMFAPIALTFTSAGIVNGYMKEMAVRMYELEALRKLKSSGLEADYHKDANKFSVDAMTGKWGLLHLMKALATNVQGAALFGDPPNIFYLQRYGREEWLKNSFIGFLLSGTISTVETNIFLRSAGLNLSTQNGLGIRDYMSAGLNTGMSMLNTLLQTSAFFEEKITGKFDNLSQKVAKWLRVRGTDYLNIDKKSLTSGLPGKAAEMFYLDPLIKTFRGVTSKGDIVGGLREIYPALDNDPETRGLLDDMRPENFTDVEDMKRYLVKKGILEEQRTQDIIDGFNVPGTTDSHEVHLNGHNLSHAALDVRNALLTQLWAVGSLQVVVKKILGLDQEKKPSKNEALMKIGAIMGTIAGISGIADNVAAMLFGIDVLEEIGRKTLGEEEYNNNPEFQEALRRWAFLTAVAAGCLTLIGNGPNMVLEVIDEVYRNDETDVLDAITRKMQMGESAANLHGPLSVAATLSVGFTEIWYQLDKALAKEVK